MGGVVGGQGGVFYEGPRAPFRVHCSPAAARYGSCVRTPAIQLNCQTRQLSVPRTNMPYIRRRTCGLTPRPLQRPPQSHPHRPHKYAIGESSRFFSAALFDCTLKIRYEIVVESITREVKKSRMISMDRIWIDVFFVRRAHVTCTVQG